MRGTPAGLQKNKGSWLASLSSRSFIFCTNSGLVNGLIGIGSAPHGIVHVEIRGAAVASEQPNIDIAICVLLECATAPARFRGHPHAIQVRDDRPPDEGWRPMRPRFCGTRPRSGSRLGCRGRRPGTESGNRNDEQGNRRCDERRFLSNVFLAICLLELPWITEPHIHRMAVGVLPCLHECEILRTILRGAKRHRVGVSHLHEISRQPGFVVNARSHGRQRPISHFAVRVFHVRDRSEYAG